MIVVLTPVGFAMRVGAAAGFQPVPVASFFTMM